MRRRSRHLPQPRLHHEKGAGHVVAQAHDSDSRGGDSKAATIGADPAGGWPGCVPPSAGVGCHPYVCTVARWRVPHVGAAAGGNCEERGGEEAGARDLRAQEQSNIRGEGKRDANTAGTLTQTVAVAWSANRMACGGPLFCGGPRRGPPLGLSGLSVDMPFDERPTPGRIRKRWMEEGRERGGVIHSLCWCSYILKFAFISC